MNLGWDSVLKLAAVGVLMMIALQLSFYFVFQKSIPVVFQQHVIQGTNPAPGTQASCVRAQG